MKPRLSRALVEAESELGSSYMGGELYRVPPNYFKFKCRKQTKRPVVVNKVYLKRRPR